MISWWPWLLNAYIICHLSLVMFLHYLTYGAMQSWVACQKRWRLPDITEKPKIYVFFPLTRTDFSCKWLWKEPVMWLDYSRCSKWRPFAFTHGCSHVCHWSVAFSMMSWGIQSQISVLQLVNVAFQFLCSGSVETYLRWGGKLCMCLIAKVIRISHAKFHCNRLTTVQNIQDYTSRTFFGNPLCISMWLGKSDVCVVCG